MSEITRFFSWDGNEFMHEDPDGEYVQYADHLAEVERLKAMLPPTAHTGVRNGPGEGSWSVFAGKVVEERDEAQAEVERLTAERDAARAEVERLRANGQGMFDSSRPRGREVGRFGLDGHYLDYEALKPTRPSDEDIWREAFITMLPSYPWEKAAEHADRVLAEYRKRWPR